MTGYLTLILVLILAGGTIAGIYNIEQVRRRQDKCPHKRVHRYSNLRVCLDCDAHSDGPFQKKAAKRQEGEA